MTRAIENIPAAIAVRECRWKDKRGWIEPQVNGRVGERAARNAIRPLAVSGVRRIGSNARRERRVGLPCDDAAGLPSLRDTSKHITTVRRQGDRIDDAGYPTVSLIVIGRTFLPVIVTRVLSGETLRVSRQIIQ